MKVLLSWMQEFAPIEGDPQETSPRRSSRSGSSSRTCPSSVRAGTASWWPRFSASDRTRRPTASNSSTSTPVDGEPLQICCGAFNMAVGDLVPLATLGTVMPGGLEIARRQMRGEWSNGMLCSADRARGRGGRRRHPHPSDPASAWANRWPTRSAPRPMCCSTSTSRATAPTPSRWPAWHEIWRPSSACRSRTASRCSPNSTRRPRNARRSRSGPRTSASGSVPGCSTTSPSVSRRRGWRPASTAAGMRSDQLHRRHLELRDARAGAAQPHL